MYSSSRSATHHIFFPPRLEVVVEQQNTDGFPAHSWHQFPFNRLLGYQSHAPTGVALGWLATYHGNDALLPVCVQHFGRSGPLLLIESAIQTGLLVTMAESPDRLQRQGDHLGDLGRTGLFGQLQ